MPFYNLQASFASGEVSPDIYGRTDLKYYSVAAKTMRNFYPNFFGGASNRPGLRFIGEVKDSTKKTRLLPFQFSTEQAYIIEAGEDYFRYYKDGGQIINVTADAWVTSTVYAVDKAVIHNSLVYRCILSHTASATDEPGVGASWSTYWIQSNVVETTTNYNASDLFELKIAQSADTMFICNSKYKPRELSRSSHYDWSIIDFPYENGPFRVQNVTSTTVTSSATTGTTTLTASSGIFDSSMIGSLFQISHDVTGQSINTTYSAGATSAAIKCKGDWNIVTTSTWAGTVELQWSKDKGTTWETIRTYRSASDTNIEDSGSTDDLVLLRIKYTYTSGSCTVNLNAYSFIMDGVVEITAVSSATSATATVKSELAFTTATDNWAIGAWNDKYGYPACVKFYQNRLAFASTTKDPLTAWFSQTGDYPNFLVNETLEDSDAITAPLVSQGVNSIRSMVSLGNMLGFTAGGEWKIGPASDSQAFTPSNIKAVQQGYRGSSTLEPIIIGDRVLYCQEMGSIVRDFGYSLTEDVYKGDDLTVLAKHLFRNHSIVDWAYQQEPDSIIWAVREDGVLLSFTYLKEQDIWSWARHDTDGTFESVATIAGDGYNEVYFIVRRLINGTYKRYVEVLTNRMSSSDPQDQFFVDSGLSYDNPLSITATTKASPVVVTSASHGLTAGDVVDISSIVGMTELNGNRYKVGTVTTDTFQLLNYDDSTNIDGTSFTTYVSGGYARKAIKTVTGLSHLEGKTVSILANGSVEPTQVVASGTITLDDYASRIHVGLPYKCELETLNVDFPLQNGTMQGRFKQIANATIRLEKSAGGCVGYNGGTDYQGNDITENIDYELGEYYGTPAPLFTGDKMIHAGYNEGKDATIYICQSSPLPLTVLAIISEVDVGES